MRGPRSYKYFYINSLGESTGTSAGMDGKTHERGRVIYEIRNFSPLVTRSD
jgi:hypothetical protein